MKSGFSCLITIIGLLFCISISNGEQVKKTTVEYFAACDCQTFQIYRLGEDGSTFKVEPSTDGTVTEHVVPDPEFPGSSQCNSILTNDGKFAYIDVGQDLAYCAMSGRYSHVKGFYKAAKGKTVLISGQYKVNGSWNQMETIVKIGVPYWSEFDYNVDLEDLNNVEDFRILIASPDPSTPVLVDEITMCSYCKGLQREGPKISELVCSTGELDREFSSNNLSYILTIKDGSSKVKFTPISYTTGAGISIKYNNVYSSTPPEIDIKDGSTVWISIEKSSSACEKTMYKFTMKYPDKSLNKKIIYVDYDPLSVTVQDGTSWLTAYPTIEKALSKAKTLGSSIDCEIWIAEGEYKSNSIRYIESGVKIYGGFPAHGGKWEQRNTDKYKVVLKNTGVGEIVQISSTTYPVTLDGLYLGQSAGNGIFIKSQNDVKINDCDVYQNNGIGIFSSFSNSLSMNGCKIYSNQKGGVVVNELASDLLIKDCDVSDNYKNDGKGAGMNISSILGSTRIVGCKIERNNCEFEFGGGGGGLYVNTGASVSIVNCAITNNKAYNGGGIYLDHYLANPHVNIVNCLIAGNIAKRNGLGGGIYSQAIDLKVINCSVVENCAVTKGGGIFWLDNYGNAQTYILNSVFWGNKIPGYVPTPPQTDISQLASNSNNPVPINYSCIQDNSAGDGFVYPAPAAETNKNFDTDPKFVANGSWNGDYSIWTKGDYHLTNISSCLDKGVVSGDLLDDVTDIDDDGDVTELIPIDLGGNPRFFDSDGNNVTEIDAGAYECQKKSEIDPTLNDLKVSNGTLSPDFHYLVTSYQCFVLLDVNEIKLIPIANDPAATIKVNGQTVITGNEVIIDVSSNKNITIVVTGKDGVTTQTYNVTVTCRTDRIYVDKNSPGPTHDGQSWNTAYLHPQTAIGSFNKDKNCEIWVADGYYSNQDQNFTYGVMYLSSIKYNFPNVKEINIYGGFKGAENGGYETRLDQRNFKINKTVIVAVATTNQCALFIGRCPDIRVDGFYFEGDQYIGGDGKTIIENCVNDNPSGTLFVNGMNDNGDIVTFIKNYELVNHTSGGGIECNGGVAFVDCRIDNNSLPRSALHLDPMVGDIDIVNCKVTNNRNPNDNGGAIYVHINDNRMNKNVSIASSIFENNHAVNNGGAIYFDNFWGTGVLGTYKISNCTFSGNEAIDGGAIYTTQYCPLEISNSVFHNDVAYGAGYVVFYTSALTFYNSNFDDAGIGTYERCYQDGTCPFAMINCFHVADPLLDVNLKPQSGSICIGNGDLSRTLQDLFDLDGDGNRTEYLPFDIAGNNRQIGTIDIGAFEQ